METVTLSEARVYVGTYNKYNSGSLFGKWLDLFDYWDKDEFMEACRELHKDDQDPELMFQDYENIPEALISESWLSGCHRETKRNRAGSVFCMVRPPQQRYKRRRCGRPYFFF